MFKKLKNTVIFITGAYLVSGCATILSESEYLVNIDSSASNSKVTVKDSLGTALLTASTPTSIMLSASEGSSAARYIFYFEKQGYESHEEWLAASRDKWFMGNLLIGGIFGMLIDWSSGAMWKLDDSVYANMEKNKETLQLKKNMGSPSFDYVGNKLQSKQPIMFLEKTYPNTGWAPSEQFKNISTKLLKLKALYDLDLLTKEEFESRRKSLVSQM